MTQTINVHFLPNLTDPQSLAGAPVAVIDVLRATTTIVHALAAGARDVIPCLDIAQAREAAGKRPGSVLGGERQGKKIQGFDLGNTPTDYQQEIVGGRTVVFTTTNGTRALTYCTGASEVLIASFSNLSAVAGDLAGHEVVHLLCAGTNGEITREDALLAGAIVQKMRGDDPAVHGSWKINDQARLALDAWNYFRATDPTLDHLAKQLRQTQGGRNLAAIDLATDIDVAAEIDRFAIVPRLDHRTWSIR